MKDTVKIHICADLKEFRETLNICALRGAGVFVPFFWPRGSTVWTRAWNRLRGKPPAGHRWLRGPINAGDEFVWEPGVPHAEQVVRVVDINWNGEEWYVNAVNLTANAYPAGAVGKRYWNDAHRFREACVRVAGVQPPKEWPSR